ncbi:MAG: WbqC family protein [Bacteroidales bacterium]|nr:WbqC family protein [Bacteroidales bacterium]
MLVSTTYFPPLAYFAYIANAQTVCVEAHEHYIKQSYRNRCTIYSANGLLDLIVPVEKPQGSKTLIRDVQISYAEAWVKQHKHAFVSAYKSSPFFDYYADACFAVLDKQEKFLWDLNEKLLHTLCKLIGLSPTISASENFTPLNSIANDLRYAISPKRPLELPQLPYSQVFDEKFGFQPAVSVFDAICNLGPDTKDYLLSESKFTGLK